MSLLSQNKTAFEFSEATYDRIRYFDDHAGNDAAIPLQRGRQ